MLSTIKRYFHQKQDVIITDLLYLLPCALKWLYHLKIKKDIFPFKLENSSKKAYLYQHGEWKSENGKTKGILILHGLYSHPFVMLHLAKMAKKTHSGPVFSLYVSYDFTDHEIHRGLIKQALDTIENMVTDQGDVLNGIVLAGHSMGAIESAYKGFVKKDKRIISVISIAGRLKLIEPNDKSCRESLKETVNQIYKAIEHNPDFPLYQIVATHDWNASLEATLIRKIEGYYHIVENAMHFNILFHKDLEEKFPEFLRKSLRD